MLRIVNFNSQNLSLKILTTISRFMNEIKLFLMKFHFKTPCDYLTAIKEFRKTPENCQKFPKLPHSIEWKVKKKFHSFLFYILFGSTRH